MFSDHLQKKPEVPYTALLGVAAGLVFVCLLVGMALVVEGQVQKSQMRDAQSTSERNAIAGCMESTMGAALNSCIRQVKGNNNVAVADLNDSTRNKASGSAQGRQNAVVPIQPPHGLTPASFAAR